MKAEDPIFVAGHRGLVGSAIVRRLREAGFDNLLLRSRAELDLMRQRDVDDFFATARPRYVFMAAAKVGVPDYKNLVNQKLTTARDLYRFMVDQSHQSRALTLELMVVIILIIDLIVLFSGKR